MSLGDPPHDIDDTAPLPELIQQLRELNRELPEAVQAQVLAVGSASIPDLIAILEEALADDDADHGWAPSHAAKLLGMLGDTQAVPVLLRILEHYEVIDGYHQEAEDALVALGHLAIEACLEAYPTASNEDLRKGIVSVLSRSAEKNERIYQTLLDFFEQSTELGAIYLAEYGDPQAIPALSQMFDALPFNDQDDSVMSNHIFTELRSAIEQLGGQLTAAQRAKADRADAPRRRFAAQMQEAVKRIAAQQSHIEQASSISLESGGSVIRRQRTLGRNDPCWCGSGKKYKKCHLDLEHC
jgi:NADPH-dependent ferric siderophore reductase